MKQRPAESAPPSFGRRIFRKQLVIPTEHGSWTWLLVPYFVGLAVAAEWNLAAFLVLIGGLAGFLLRQPVTAWVRIRAGRGRKADASLAAGWSLALALVAAFCLLGLLALGRTELFWLLIPMAAIMALYLAAGRERRVGLRTLWMELVGAIGLAAMAPAAYIAATGHIDGTAWALWGLMAGQNALGVLYVRLRIADTHGRPVARSPILNIHALVLAVMVLATFVDVIPWLAVVPFAGFFGRAVWAVGQVRPVENIKRFGFTEIGVEILGGLIIIASYWFW